MNNDEIESFIVRVMLPVARFGRNNSSIPEKSETKARSNSLFRRLFHNLKLLIYCTKDFIQLYFLFSTKKGFLKNKKIVYTGRDLCIEENGKLYHRVIQSLFVDNIIFINTSKDVFIDLINGQKVYNLGGLTKLIRLISRKSEYEFINTFYAFSILNDLLLKHVKQQDVYIFWYYNPNSFSLIFSKFRRNFNLIEVQHGSIINFSAYTEPSPFRLCDVYYVKNDITINYLKSHLCLNFLADFRRLPYPKVEGTVHPGVHLLYASSVEVNGLHPVLKKFLSENSRENLDLLIRLHPRERAKEETFNKELRRFDIKFRFDRTKNWLESNKIKNLIVISPWSSTIEDAYDNGFTTIIIDPIGYDRFSNFVDNQICFYSNDIESTLSDILKT